MSKNWWIVIIIVVALVILGWWWIQSQKSQTVTQPQTPTDTSTIIQAPSPTTAESTTSGEMMKKEEYTVKITATGFSPKTLTIKAGETVTWMNDDNAVHNVNSAPHPAHTDYQPLNLGSIQPSGSKSLTFPVAGTYKYHDHLNPTLFGSITVE